MQAYLERMDPRSVPVILGALLLLITAALATYVLAPPFKSHRAAVDSLRQVRNAAQSKGALGEGLAAMKQEVEALRRRLRGDTANLPPKQVEAYIIGKLQGLSWRHSLELSSVQPEQGQPFHIFQETLFRVEVLGDYFDLFDWLQELGQELGFVVIKEFELQPVGGDTQRPLLKMRLTLASYRTAQP